MRFGCIALVFVDKVVGGNEIVRIIIILEVFGEFAVSDKISILRYLKDEEDTIYRCKLSSMDKLENTGKHE